MCHHHPFPSRSAADMPPSMGKGRVAVLGEAAHPLRPTGQDANMALEDAAELAAFVQVRLL